MDNDLVYKEESFAIIGACLEVYNVMGPGFLESVYHKCLEREFTLRGIPYVSQKRIGLLYKGYDIAQDCVPDFLCYDKIIVEIKAASKLVDENRAQLLNYLNATQLRLGWLINFGHHKTLEKERYVFTKHDSR